MPSNAHLRNEFRVEAATIVWFWELGDTFVRGPEIAPGEPAAERLSFANTVLVGHLRDTVDRLNPRGKLFETSATRSGMSSAH